MPLVVGRLERAAAGVVRRDCGRRARCGGDRRLGAARGRGGRGGRRPRRLRHLPTDARAAREADSGPSRRASEELTALPGVGRKTANVVLGNAFNKAVGIVVDTHVIRLSQRLRLTRQNDPEKIEADLMKIVPRKHWTIWSHWLIWHGRRRCFARKPDCSQCEVLRLCPSGKIFLRTGEARSAEAAKS